MVRLADHWLIHAPSGSATFALNCGRRTLEKPRVPQRSLLPSPAAVHFQSYNPGVIRETQVSILSTWLETLVIYASAVRRKRLPQPRTWAYREASKRQTLTEKQDTWPSHSGIARPRSVRLAQGQRAVPESFQHIRCFLVNPLRHVGGLRSPQYSGGGAALPIVTGLAADSPVRLSSHLPSVCPSIHPPTYPPTIYHPSVHPVIQSPVHPSIHPANT